MEGVLKNRTVKINGEPRELVPDVLEPEVVTENMNVYIMLTGKLSVGDIVYPIALAEPLAADGIVEGQLVTETLSPVSLFFN